MRVLQFAFHGHADNPHLPDDYVHNTVVYTGTHDNPTTRGWFEALPEPQRQNVWDYLRRPGEDIGEAAPALTELAWNSAAALAMAPLQDLLNLGDEARMNRPGRTEGNWRWRCTEAMLSLAVWQWLHDLTSAANRAPAITQERIDRVLNRPECSMDSNRSRPATLSRSSVSPSSPFSPSSTAGRVALRWRSRF